MNELQKRICLIQAQSLRNSTLAHELELMGFHVMRIFDLAPLPLIRESYYPDLVITHHIYPSYLTHIFKEFHFIRTPILCIVQDAERRKAQFDYYQPNCAFIRLSPRALLKVAIEVLLASRYDDSQDD